MIAVLPEFSLALVGMLGGKAAAVVTVRGATFGKADCGDGEMGVFGLLTPRGRLTGDEILGRFAWWLSESSESDNSISSTTLPLGSLRETLLVEEVLGTGFVG